MSLKQNLGYDGASQDLYYHGSPRSARESILASGLQAHQPGAGMLTEEEIAQESEHPKGVYITKSLEHAQEYGDDVWLIDCSGLTYQYGGQDESVAEDIAPDRLTHAWAFDNDLAPVRPALPDVATHPKPLIELGVELQPIDPSGPETSL